MSGEPFDFEAPTLEPEPVIPDSITPEYGYKALNVMGDRLFSPSFTVAWPAGKPLEAHCSAGASNWSWMPVEGEQRSLESIIEASAQMRGGFLTASTASSSVAISPASLRISRPPPKPNNPLPPGWSWSWEPQTHDAPAEDCHCGIYVASRPEQCLQYLNADSGVIAKIAVWGRTIRAHSGARGQYAYPQGILVPAALEESVHEVALRYNIPLDVLDRDLGAEPDEEAKLKAAIAAQAAAHNKLMHLHSLTPMLAIPPPTVKPEPNGFLRSVSRATDALIRKLGP